jgi:hypothetical protein
MNKTIAANIRIHKEQGQKYLRLASDNYAVADSEKGLTPASLERHKEYLGYAEDYALAAHKMLGLAYRLLSDELHKANLPVNK